MPPWQVCPSFWGRSASVRGGEEMLQVVGQILGRGVPFHGSLGQGFEADPLQFFWYRVVVLPRRARLLPDYLFGQFRLCVALERSTAQKSFVQNYTKTEDVTSPIYAVPFTASLFGTHVRWCAQVLWTFADVLFLERQAEINDKGSPLASTRMLPGLTSRCTSPLLCA